MPPISSWLTTARPPVGAVRRGHVRSGGCGRVSVSESEISGESSWLQYEALHSAGSYYVLGSKNDKNIHIYRAVG